MTDFRRLIETLSTAQVDYMLVGGVAATVHGSVRLTADVDIVDLPTLIRVKRAAGRPKDLESIAELETILEERGRAQ